MILMFKLTKLATVKHKNMKRLQQESDRIIEFHSCNCIFDRLEKSRRCFFQLLLC